MTIYATNGIAGPTRVLLLGNNWAPIQDALAAATAAGAITLIGPEPAYHAAQDHSAHPPDIILLAPDDDTILEPDAANPPTIRCVADTDLDAPDLYDHADDFIVTPCAPAELTKRILRLVRRHHNAAGDAATIRVGGIALNPATYQVTAAGRPVDLAWLEFRLLLFLMQNVGQVFTRDQLLANVWGVANIGGTRTVDVHIRRLRYKLETGGATYFRTVKNVGYGMMEP